MSNLDLEVLSNNIELDILLGDENPIDFEFGDGYERYKGNYSVVPNFQEQKLNTKNKIMNDDVIVTPIPVTKVSNSSGGNTIIIGG